MHSNHSIVGSALLVLGLSACAAAVPKELSDARAAYDRASHGEAAQLAPSDVHKAKSALDQAELAFDEEGDERHTRDLAYVALRKAQLAEVTASRASEVKTKEQAEQDLQKAQANKQVETDAALTQARADLTTSKTDLASSQKDAAQAQKDAADADARAKELEARLAQLASVKEDERGMVLTLSGSLLFSSNKSTLLPAAETRLSEVAAALQTKADQKLRIEGYTDSRGSDSSNVTLSQARADAVRTYLLTRGFEADNIQAQGMGETKPIASNDDPDGRANNRRVEIVVSK